MAGYRTPEEIFEIINEEQLQLDVDMTIIGGNNSFGYQVMMVPKECIHFRKEEVVINLPNAEENIVVSVSEFPCKPKHCLYFIVKDGDSYIFSIYYPDHEDEISNSDEQKMRKFEKQCILEFLEKKKINTRGKLLKLLKDGYQMYKDILGLEDSFELQKDAFLSAEDSPVPNNLVSEK